MGDNDQGGKSGESEKEPIIEGEEQDVIVEEEIREGIDWVEVVERVQEQEEWSWRREEKDLPVG